MRELLVGSARLYGMTRCIDLIPVTSHAMPIPEHMCGRSLSSFDAVAIFGSAGVARTVAIFVRPEKEKVKREEGRKRQL